MVYYQVDSLESVTDAIENVNYFSYSEEGGEVHF